MITEKIQVTKNNRRVNVNSYLIDSERDDTTLNMSWKHSRQYNTRKRKENSLEFKIRQVLHIVCTFALVILLWSIWIRGINAEEVTLESIIEKSEHTEQDIDTFVELLDKEVGVSIMESEEITPENIEASDKSYEDFMKKWEELHKIRYEEQKKNSEVIEQAFEIIIKFEWFHDKPYWDYSQWSCGYGMRCSKDTTGITKEKSKQFVMERIKSIRIKHNLEQYDDNMEVALISFIYNIGHAPVWMDRYIKNNHINALKGMMRKYSYAWGKYLRGLALRRNYETSLF